MFQVGDRVRTADEQLEGVIFSMGNATNKVSVIDSFGRYGHYRIDDVLLVAAANYNNRLAVGDKVSVKEFGGVEVGVIFAIDPKEKLPYSLGFKDGSTERYSSKELTLVAKAVYQNPVEIR